MGGKLPFPGAGQVWEGAGSKGGGKFWPEHWGLARGKAADLYTTHRRMPGCLVGQRRYFWRMDNKAPSFVPKTWDLPEALRVRLGDQAGKQRLMDEDGHLLLILHRVPKPEDDETRHPVLFWRTPEGEWKSTASGPGLVSLEGHLAEFRHYIHALDESVEAARTPREYFDLLRAINPVLRTTRNLLAVMQEARKARPNERKLIVLRDHAVDLERAIDLAANDARAGMEFALAESNEAQAQEARLANQEARRLNRLVAFFFPLATLVAIFGMEEPARVLAFPGFWAVIGVGLAIGAFLVLTGKGVGKA
jgi:hypothetical protein